MFADKFAVPGILLFAVCLGSTTAEGQGALSESLRKRDSWTLINGDSFSGRPVRIDVGNVTLRAKGEGATVNGVEYASLDPEQFIRNAHSLGGLKVPSDKKIKDFLAANDGAYSANSVIIVFDREGEQIRLPAAMLATKDRSAFNSAVSLLKRNIAVAEQRRQQAVAAAGTWYQLVCEKCGWKGMKTEEPSALTQAECFRQGCGGLCIQRPCAAPGAE